MESKAGSTPLPGVGVVDHLRVFNYVREVVGVLIVFLSGDGPVAVPEGVRRSA